MRKLRERLDAGARCEYNSAVSALRRSADGAKLVEIEDTMRMLRAKCGHAEFVTKTTSELA